MRIKEISYLTATVLLSCSLVLAAVLWAWPNPIRWIIVFLFILFCPGMAFSHLLPGRDRLVQVFLIVVLSVAIDLVVTQAILYWKKWSPHLILWLLVGTCLVGVISKYIQDPSGYFASAPLLGEQNKNQGWISRLHCFSDFIRHGWRLVLLSSLVAVNLSLVNSFFFAMPMYVASANFVVTPNQEKIISATDAGNGQNIPDMDTIISTYADNINSYAIRSATLQLLQKTPDSYSNYLTSVDLFPEQNLIRFNVKGPNPEVAALLANSIGQHAIDSIRKFYPYYDIRFLSKASVPTDVYSPRPLVEAIQALFIGMMFGLGFVMLRKQGRLPNN